jgi:hypothetical protein
LDASLGLALRLLASAPTCRVSRGVCKAGAVTEMRVSSPVTAIISSYAYCQPTSFSLRSCSFASISGQRAWHSERGLGAGHLHTIPMSQAALSTWHCSHANSTNSLLDPCNHPRFLAQLQQYNIVVSPLRSTATPILTPPVCSCASRSSQHPAHTRTGRCRDPPPRHRSRPGCRSPCSRSP